MDYYNEQSYAISYNTTKTFTTSHIQKTNSGHVLQLKLDIIPEKYVHRE